MVGKKEKSRIVGKKEKSRMAGKRRRAGWWVTNKGEEQDPIFLVFILVVLIYKSGDGLGRVWIQTLGGGSTKSVDQIHTFISFF